MITRNRPLIFSAMLLGASLSTPAMAADSAVQAASTPDPSSQAQKPVVAYCPEPAILTLKNGSWTAPGWSSANSSFITKLTRFIAAQWRGTNIGKILCVYGGDQVYTFPVALENNEFVSEPSGGSWGGAKDGTKNCIATHVERCPFAATPVTTTPKQGNMDIPHISEQSKQEQERYLWLGGAPDASQSPSPSSGQ